MDLSQYSMDLSLHSMICRDLIKTIIQTSKHDSPIQIHYVKMSGKKIKEQKKEYYEIVLSVSGYLLPLFKYFLSNPKCRCPDLYGVTTTSRLIKLETIFDCLSDGLIPRDPYDHYCTTDRLQCHYLYGENSMPFNCWHCNIYDYCCRIEHCWDDCVCESCPAQLKLKMKIPAYRNSLYIRFILVFNNHFINLNTIKISNLSNILNPINVKKRISKNINDLLNDKYNIRLSNDLLSIIYNYLFHEDVYKSLHFNRLSIENFKFVTNYSYDACPFLLLAPVQADNSFVIGHDGIEDIFINGECLIGSHNYVDRAKLRIIIIHDKYDKVISIIIKLHIYGTYPSNDGTHSSDDRTYPSNDGIYPFGDVIFYPFPSNTYTWDNNLQCKYDYFQRNHVSGTVSIQFDSSTTNNIIKYQYENPQNTTTFQVKITRCTEEEEKSRFNSFILSPSKCNCFYCDDICEESFRMNKNRRRKNIYRRIYFLNKKRNAYSIGYNNNNNNDDDDDDDNDNDLYTYTKTLNPRSQDKKKYAHCFAIKKKKIYVQESIFKKSKIEKEK